MKQLAFLTTFLAYTTIHCMRMSLSSLQHHIIAYFGISNSSMGLAIAAVYIILGLSYLLRTFVPLRLPQRTYLITTCLAAVSYSILPIAVSYGVKHVGVLFTAYALFGLFQSSTWPVLIKIVNKYLDPQRDGCLMGLWSTNGDIGNIMGFLSCLVIEFYLKWPWHICLYFSAAITLVMALAIFFLPIQNPEELNE